VDVSNRSLLLLLGITVLLVSGAAFLTLRSRIQVEEPPAPTGPTSVKILPDVSRQGGRDLHPTGVLIVTLEEGQSARSATLECPAIKSERPFFEMKLGWDSVPDANCTLRLDGTEAAFGPVYPSDELLCHADANRTVCTGGVASTHMAVMAVTSKLPGTLEVDGDDVGQLPLADISLRPGMRSLVVHLDDGRAMEWTLGVKPDEHVTVNFPSPDAERTAPAAP
jgi:hypothetical protein